MRSANYVQETTTSIAGTAGNGAVTTTAIAGFPRISDALGTSKRFVRYVIEDTVGNKFESGIGSIASNVLTRVSPQVTWDGTALVQKSAATPLPFGATPTAGNIVVRLAATAEGVAPITNVRQSTIAGDATWRDYPLSEAFGSWSGNGTGATLVAGNEYYIYYKLDAPGFLNGAQINVTAFAGTTIKAALYEIANNGLPGAKILDFTGFPSSTSGVKTDTAIASWAPAGGVWLTPGWYVIGLISDSNPAILGSSGNGINRQTPLGRYNPYGFSSAITVAGMYTAGLPAIPNLTGANIIDPGGSTLAAMWLGLKVSP